MSRAALVFLLCCALPASLGSGALAADEPALRVLVLDNAPPMSFRDESGQLTGFSVEIARAVRNDGELAKALDALSGAIAAANMSSKASRFSGGTLRKRAGMASV